MTQTPIRPLSSTDGEGTKHIISPDVQKVALKDWVRRSRDDLNYGSLGYCIDRALGETWKGPWPFARAADSLIRRLKDAEWITKSPKGRNWQLTAAGKDALGAS